MKRPCDKPVFKKNYILIYYIIFLIQLQVFSVNSSAEIAENTAEFAENILKSV